MGGALVAAIVVATAFYFTNGVHDAADAVATLVATRTAKAASALAVAVGFTLLGPLVLGAAVADTVGKVVDVPQGQLVAVIGAGVGGALVWNLFSWWRGLPSSSTHALIGGLVGAAIAADGIHAVGWGTVGLVLAALVLSPALGAPVSTSQVVASSVAGVGGGQRWHHVHWHVVRNIGLAWLVTMPVCAMLGALALPLWRWVT
jgi:PiT family inorganic phosphate transporter